jgi:hypothetical protein
LKANNNLIKTNETETNVSLKIFFKRKNIRFIVETWQFCISNNNYNSNNNLKRNEQIKLRMMQLFKKISTCVRSMALLCKMLPVYSMFMKKGFDFSFEYELALNSVDLNSDKTFNTFNKKFVEYNIFNFTDSFGSIEIKLKYLHKNDIFKTEEQMVINKFLTYLDSG